MRRAVEPSLLWLWVTCLLAAAAAAALPRCDSGVGGVWQRDDEGKPKAWVMTPPCRWRIDSRADAEAHFRGARIFVGGDSVSRMFFYELALWLSGCVEPAEPDADRRACADFKSNRMNRDPRVIEVPLVGVTLEFLWITHVHGFVEALDAILAKEADIYIFGTGFWHMRHPRGAGDGAFDGALPQTHRLLERLAQLAPVSDRRRTVMWRSMTQIEMSQDAFNPGYVREMNAAMDAAWREAGRIVVNVEYLGACPRGTRVGTSCKLTWEVRPACSAKVGCELRVLLCGGCCSSPVHRYAHRHRVTRAPVTTTAPHTCRATTLCPPTKCK